MKSKLMLLAAIGAGALSTAQAGDIYLTGHDVLLHSGQAGYDAVIIDYLRGVDAKATYSVGVIGTSGVGFAAFTGGANITGGAPVHAIPLAGTMAGYGSATFYDAATLAATGPAAVAATLAGLDLLIIESHISCGGCSLTDAGVVAVNSMAAEIATAFNAGMDIWGQSGSSSATYYGFLPPTAVATGAPIGGAFGFTATAAGAGIGIVDATHINGYPTHNRFASHDAAFTVMETRGTEIISLGLKGGTITTGGITVPDSGSTSLFLVLIAPLFVLLRRFRSARA